MGGIQFEEPSIGPIIAVEKPTGMVGWIIKVSGGRITTREQASLTLLILATGLIVFSGIVLLTTQGAPEQGEYVDPRTGRGLVPEKDPYTF